MPYIVPERRILLDSAIDHLFLNLEVQGFKDGDLNYCISRLLALKWKQNPSYSLAAMFKGVLGNVADEFYRRFAAPYEDNKMKQNGDII